MRPLHRVFISSPYTGLEEERLAIIRGVLQYGWQPVAMEYIPASPGPSWETLRELIRHCDAFLSILGGLIGTIREGTENPVAELEYDLAKEFGIPIVNIVHQTPHTLPKYETNAGRRALFERFRAKLMREPNWCLMWATREDIVAGLPGALDELAKRAGPGLIKVKNPHLLDAITDNGITHIYKTRDAASSQMLDDIRASRKSCWISAGVHVRGLILPEYHSRFCEAIAHASSTVPRGSRRYRLTFCSLSPDTSESSRAGKGNFYILDSWRLREHDDDISPLQRRINRASGSFETIARHLATHDIECERRFFHDYLLPHSLVVIDEKIAYVSFYDWVTPAGNSALTMRFDGGHWGDTFVQESLLIRNRYSYRDYRVIAFDFDGVIADSMPIQARTWEHAAERAHVSGELRSKLLTNFWRGAAGDRMFEGVKVDEPTRKLLRDTKDTMFLAAEQVVPVFAACPSALRALRSTNHFKLALCTTAKKQRVFAFFDRYGLNDVFDLIITDSDVEKKKPHPEMLLKAAEQLGAQPWQTCLVGDTETDYMMSSRAGTDFILFRSHDRGNVPKGCAVAKGWDQLAQMLLNSILKSSDGH